MISPYIIGKNFFLLSVENHVDILGRSGGNAEKSTGISANFPGNVRETPQCRERISRMEDGFRTGAPENDANSPPGTPPKSAAQPSNLPLRLPFSPILPRPIHTRCGKEIPVESGRKWVIHNFHRPTTTVTL